MEPESGFRSERLTGQQRARSSDNSSIKSATSSGPSGIEVRAFLFKKTRRKEESVPTVFLMSFSRFSESRQGVIRPFHWDFFQLIQCFTEGFVFKWPEALNEESI
jgi:hypothetical protein